MPMLPIGVESLVLIALSIAWLAWHRQVNRLPENQPYHLAAHRRDLSKARFYVSSVWGGLLVAFLSFRCLEAVSGLAFDTTQTRAWTIGILRGLTMGGLLVIGAVWSQVAQRASQPNADGRSLTPLPEERTSPYEDRTR